jgi:hypothetical protein
MRKIIINYFLTIIAIAGPTNLPYAANSDEAVLKFYIGKVDSTINQYYLFESQRGFSVEIESRLYETNYRGIVSDSSIASCYFTHLSNGTDSIDAIKQAKDKNNKIPDSFILSKPWKETYRFYFYPNDTGAGELAIGFDPAAESEISLPSGFMMINRDDYFIRSIIFYFPNKEGYKKYSETYKFDSIDGFISPKSIEINGARATFTGIEYFRQILEFKNYRIY